MRRLRAFGRWLIDWRTGVTFAVTVLGVAFLIVVLDARDARQNALDTAQATVEQALDQRAAATRRIDLLNEQIEELSDEQAATSNVIGTLVAQVDALRAQVAELGGEPVVVAAGETPRSDDTTPPTTQPDAENEPDNEPPAPAGPAPEDPPPPDPESPLCIPLLGLFCQETTP